MDTKVSTNRQKKEQLVANLSEKMIKAQALVFTNYQGLTHKQIENLKKAIKPADGEYLVAKNTLILRSLGEAKLKVEDENLLEGPTGTLFANGDAVEPLKHLAKAIKDLGLPTVKFGFFEGKHVSADEILRLSVLPPRAMLIAQFVGGMKSPLFGIHRALNWNIQKLVITLKEIEKTKPAEAQAAPVVADSPVVEEAVEPTEATPTETTKTNSSTEESANSTAEEATKEQAVNTENTNDETNQVDDKPAEG